MVQKRGIVHSIFIDESSFLVFVYLCAYIGDNNIQRKGSHQFERKEGDGKGWREEGNDRSDTYFFTCFFSLLLKIDFFFLVSHNIF